MSDVLTPARLAVLERMREAMANRVELRLSKQEAWDAYYLLNALQARLQLAEKVVDAARCVSLSQAKLLGAYIAHAERTVRIVYAPALRDLDQRLAAYSDSKVSQEKGNP